MNIWPIILWISSIALVFGAVALMLGEASSEPGSETVSDSTAKTLLGGGALIAIGVLGWGAFGLFTLFASVAESF